MYGIIINDKNRIIESGIYAIYPKNAILVDTLPEGNPDDYLYIDGKYIYDPLPLDINEDKPTQLDEIQAQVAYTAMMTGTLIY